MNKYIPFLLLLVPSLLYAADLTTKNALDPVADTTIIYGINTPDATAAEGKIALSILKTYLDSITKVGTPAQYEWGIWTGDGTLKGEAITGSRAVVTDANGEPAAATTTATEIGYVNGVTSALQTQIDGKQTLDTELSAVAALTSAADKGIQFTGSGTAAVYDLTTYAKTILDDANAETAWSTILPERSGAPGTPTAGQFYFADGTTWDPSGLGISKGYYVVYDGAAYVPLFDEDGDWYINKSQASGNVIADADGITLTASQMNSTIVMTGAGDVDIPADQCDTATGKWLIVKATAAHLNSLTSNDAADQFVLSDGTTLDAGDEVDLAGAAGNQICVQCIQANKWWITGEIGTCVDGGAAD